uniref:C2H2-type domain-containing protein n=1 Tax=Ciona savignyi TaxID=51511 RepID=H2ZKL4_CIOSA
MKEEVRPAVGFPVQVQDLNHQPQIYYEDDPQISGFPMERSPERVQQEQQQPFRPPSNDDTYEEQPLCIEEDVERDQEFDQSSFQDGGNDGAEFQDSSPQQSPQRIEHTDSIRAPPPDTGEDPNERRSSSDTRSSSDSRSSELQVIKEQVKMIQQQHAYQIQMIHYLHWQLNLLTQQRQQNGIEQPAPPAAPPAQPVFNPITQLLSSNPGVLPPDPTRLAMAAMSNHSPNFAPSNVQHAFRRASISPPVAELPRAPQRPSEPQREIPQRPDANEAMLRAINQHRQHQEEHKQPNPFIFSQQQPTSIPEQVSAILRAKNLIPNRPEQHQPFAERPRPPQPLERIQNNQKAQDGAEEPFVKNQCRTCRRILSCPSALKLHYRTHTGERPYQCDLCSRAFTTRGNLRTHYSSVHRRELPPASSSGGSSVTKRGGSGKVDSHICPLCSSVFNDQIGLAQHMQMHAIVNKQQQQNLIMMKQKMLVTPQAAHSPYEQNEKSKSDSVVDLSSRRSNPTSPVRGEHSIKEGAHRSPIKPELGDFPNGIAEARHSYNALDLSNVSPGAVKPEPTENGLSDRYQQRSPVAKMASLKEGDTQRMVYPCGICFRQLDSEEDLKDHLMTHDGASSCDSPSSCNGSISSIQEPKGEMGEDARGVKRPLEIDESFQAPEAKRSMPRHWCNICKKQFSSASSLQIHTRTHTGEKPFICNVCLRSFTTKGNLKVHMGTHVWGAGGSRKGRRVSMDNPLMSTWMKNSSNTEQVAPSARPREPEVAASPSAAAIYQVRSACPRAHESRSGRGQWSSQPPSKSGFGCKISAAAAATTTTSSARR